MKFGALLCGLGLIACTTTTTQADVVFFTERSSFDAASSTSLVEDFEDFTPKDRAVGSFTRNGITYTSFADPLYVASSGYTNFGVPLTASSVLTADGDEDFTLTFASEVTAVGFDTYVNALGPTTIRVFGSAGLLDTYSLNQDPTTVGFLGITSSEPILTVRWTTVSGRVVNTGIDNVYVGLSPVPEPGTFALSLLGALGLLGYLPRRAGRRAA